MQIKTIVGQKNEYSFHFKDPASRLKPQGKYNSVYLGTNAGDGSQVLIKKLHRRWNDDDEAVSLFYAEQDLPLQHPDLILADDTFFFEGLHYAVRPFIAGQSLDAWTSRKKSNAIHELVEIGIQTLNALTVAHEQGIIHNDLRPSNLLLTEDHQVKIIDWGLSFAYNQKPRKRIKRPFGMLYASPEQMLKVYSLMGPRTDLYGLGITLYEMLTGSNPFYGDHPTSTIHLQLNIPLPAHRKVPPNLFAVLHKATAKHPFQVPPTQLNPEDVRARLAAGIEERYETALLFGEALEQVQRELAEAQANKKGFRGWLGR